MHWRVAFIKQEFPKFLNPEPTEFIDERQSMRSGIPDSGNNCFDAYLKSLCCRPAAGAEEEDEDQVELGVVMNSVFADMESVSGLVIGMKGQIHNHQMIGAECRQSQWE